MKHTAHNTSSTETAVNIATYWYLAPVRLHRGNPVHSDECWQQCGAKGTLAHTLWDCTKVTSFWESMLDDIDTYLHTWLPRFPSFILLGLPNALTYPLTSCSIALGVAHQTILALCGTTTIPMHLEWLQRLWFVLGMEKLTLTLSVQGDTYRTLWQPFIALLSQEFRELTCPRYLWLLRLTDPASTRDTEAPSE